MHGNAVFGGGGAALAWAGVVAADPTAPALTWYDDATGERVELSAATLDNWVAKTANLLVDGLGLGPGDTATVAVPPHWQTAAVLLGCWTAGLSVGSDPSDVVFASAGVSSDAPDRFFLGLAPMGLPARDLPDGWVDYVVEVRGHGDRYAGPPSSAGTDEVARAVARAGSLGLAGGRVLVDAAAYPDPVDWLLAPIVMGGSIVLCANLDRERLDARVDAEKVDVVLAPP